MPRRQCTGACSWGISGGEAIDFVNFASSITGDQARLASDGKYYLVIAPQDPGVSNWIDSAGHLEGFIFTRFQGISQSPPQTVTLTKLDQLRDVLPADIPTVTHAPAGSHGAPLSALEEKIMLGKLLFTIHHSPFTIHPTDRRDRAAGGLRRSTVFLPQIQTRHATSTDGLSGCVPRGFSRPFHRIVHISPATGE